LIDLEQVNFWLYKTSNQIRGKDYSGAIKTCKRILRYPLKKEKACADTLGYIGNAAGMEKEFDVAYQAFN
jgi:hypothetical protein